MEISCSPICPSIEKTDRVLGFPTMAYLPSQRLLHKAGEAALSLPQSTARYCQQKNDRRPQRVYKRATPARSTAPTPTTTLSTVRGTSTPRTSALATRSAGTTKGSRTVRCRLVSSVKPKIESPCTCGVHRTTGVGLTTR
jgi:hypothetical protein